MKIYSHDILLIEQSDSSFMLFHAPTLKVLSLNRQDDKTLLQFLEYYAREGEIQTKKRYGVEYDSILAQCENILYSEPYPTKVRMNRKKIGFGFSVLPIAAACNLACPYCFAQTDGGFHFRSYDKTSIKTTIDFLAKNNTNTEKIVIAFFGGEPLLKFDLITYCVNYINNSYPQKFAYSITTNGTLMTDEIVDFFKEHDFSVLVSIDGQDNEFNLRKFHNGEKSIGIVLRNIEKLRKRKVKIKLRATMVNTNPYIYSTFVFFEKLEIPFSIVFAYSSENTNHQYAYYNSSILAGIESQFRKLLSFYQDKITSNEIIYNTRFHDLLNQLKHRIIRNFSCSAGFTYFTIMSDGDIYSCPHYMNNKSRVIGNIHNEKTLDKAKQSIYSPESIAKHRSCAKCWARYLCNGGCCSQKIISGLGNTSSYSEEECYLVKLEFSVYLNICYCALKNAYGKEKTHPSHITGDC